MNTIILLDASEFVLQDTSLTVNLEKNILTDVNSEKIQTQKNIFVCTFCQVYASSDTAVVDHILEVHRNSIPSGVSAKNFVSKLQALQGKEQITIPRKVGRPRKVTEKCSSSVKKKTVIPEPVPRSDGLYWCEKCEKCFKKARQLNRHVCAEEEFEDSSSDSDTTVDYRLYMDVQPSPWSRKLKKKSNGPDLCENTLNIESRNNSVIENSQSKVKPNWRNDPGYIPLFKDEKERISFENHINSIDYTCIDHLFVKVENKIKGKRKKDHPQRSTASYSCVLCKKKFNSLTHIRMHCLTHTDQKPFTCPQCPYRSNTKGSLYTHIRIHTGSIFHCSQCTFQAVRRSHLLDHEETHSKVPQVCKMCKNSYKTIRTLIGHIRRCHNNPGGIKYVKMLSSKKPKETRAKCKACQKIFKSKSCLEIHNKTEHVVPLADLEDAGTVSENVLVPELSTISSKSSDNFANEILTVKDPYAEIVLNSLLEQKSCESTELYEDVFQQSSEILTPSENIAADVLTTVSGQLPPKGNLDECHKTLNFDIIDECLRNPTFADEVMRDTYIGTSELANGCDQPFNLGASIDLPFTSESIISSGMVGNENKDLKNEPKSAEIKLFEKCRRAPAYVCCVCQGIFICTATLKAHLKEHVNSSNSLMETAEEYVQPKIAAADTDIGGVCNILQEPSAASADNEKELEKLYSSSLDTKWYLPEVSVVLENDLSLFDAFLDEISNFSIPDKYEETNDLQV